MTIDSMAIETKTNDTLQNLVILATLFLSINIQAANVDIGKPLHPIQIPQGELFIEGDQVDYRSCVNSQIPAEQSPLSQLI